MANTFFADIIGRAALANLTQEFPLLSEISTDFSDSRATLNQTIKGRIVTPLTAQAWGQAAESAAATDVDVVMSNKRQVYVTVTQAQMEAAAGGDRNIIKELAEPLLIAIGEDFQNAIVTQLSNETDYTNHTDVALASFGYDTLVDVEAVLIGPSRKINGKRFFVPNASAYANLLKDTLVVDQGSNGGQNAITSGVISNVAGFKVMRAPGLPTGTSTKLYGVAGRKDAMVLACRAIVNPEEAFGGRLKVNGNISVISVPLNGGTLPVLAQEWIDEATLESHIRFAYMYGVAKGRASAVQHIRTTP